MRIPKARAEASAFSKSLITWALTCWSLLQRRSMVSMSSMVVVSVTEIALPPSGRGLV